jgi:hypothetical protein
MRRFIRIKMTMVRLTREKNTMGYFGEKHHNVDSGQFAWPRRSIMLNFLVEFKLEEMLCGAAAASYRAFMLPIGTSERPLLRTRNRREK